MSEQPQGLDTNWTLVFGAWFLAATGMAGSLFFSDVMGFAPCVLCWYQRIALYPLVAVLLVGLLPFDPKVVRYALPLSLVGWLIALYHTLLYEGVIPESASPCSKGVSCNEEYIELLGFLSIPALSLLCFTAIISMLLVVRARTKS